MYISENVKNCFFPPIVKAKDLIKGIRPEKKPVINLAQGVPGILPPKSAILKLIEELKNEYVHKYSDDRGLQILREEITKDIKIRHNVNVDFTSVLITAGANMSFFEVLITILNPGDKILIPVPYYFNYVMVSNFLGINVVETYVDEDIFLKTLKKEIQKGIKAVVFINPENPTGRVYSKEFIKKVCEVCLESKVYFIYDEVYRDFYLEEGEEDVRHYSPLEDFGVNDYLVILGSFSKSFGMTGYRVGYLIAKDDLIYDVLKVHDSNIICAPVPSQFLAYVCLKEFRDYPLSYVKNLREIVNLFTESMRDIKCFKFEKPRGSIFTMLYYKFKIDSDEMVKFLYKKEGVLSVSGKSFGKTSERALRISFNNLDKDKILDLKKRFMEFEKWIRKR